MVTLQSCLGAGTADYTAELSGGYEWVNEGGGVNVIRGKSSKIQNLYYLRKYIDNGIYICAWQSDSTQFNQSAYRSDQKKNDTTDKFYIIDIEKEKMEGPMDRQHFKNRTRELKIKVEWKP